MSCYFRHLKGVFAEAGFEINTANRKAVDRAIHEIMDVQYKDCPATWKNLKGLLTDEAHRREFAERLKDKLERQECTT